jgi:hypothetical protein
MNARLLKIVSLVTLGFALAVAAGWLWGAAGRWTSEQRLADAEVRLRFTDARSRILAGRVDLYSLNFGAAAQNLEGAQAVLVSLTRALEAADRNDPRLAAITSAQAALDTAKRQAGQMQPAAHAPAARALDAVSQAARLKP